MIRTGGVIKSASTHVKIRPSLISPGTITVAVIMAVFSGPVEAALMSSLGWLVILQAFIVIAVINRCTRGVMQPRTVKQRGVTITEERDESRRR